MEGTEALHELSDKVGTFYDRNKKLITYAGVAIVVLVLGYFGYQQFIVKPQEAEAAEDLYKVERMFGVDSLNLALSGNSEFKGAVDLADNYGSSPSGKKAAYIAGMCYLRKGEFENAIDYLKKYDLDDQIISCLAKGAIGDAYVELNDVENGADYYVKAAELHKNTFTSPLFFKKAGVAYESLGKNDKALKYYKQIEKDYKSSGEGADIEKYIARTEAKISQAQ